MEKIVVPDAAIRKWNARYYPEGNRRKPDNTDCQHCGDLVSEWGSPYLLTCNICQAEIDADDRHEEEFYE